MNIINEINAMNEQTKSIVVSFSGGRTSAFMARLIQEHESFAEYEKLFVFANTGKEEEETLDFIDKCDKEFSLNVVWLEAKVHPEKGVATTYTMVDYETANRKGKPFEDVIEKYGIPSKQFPHCTRELKQRPIKAFLRDIEITNYQMALGIRADEFRRVNRNHHIWGKNVTYPLVDILQVDEKFIRDWWSRQPFDLGIKDYQGNCDLCWKKSERKKLTLLREKPEMGNWWADMERKYGEGQHLFDQRAGKSISTLLADSKKPFRKVVDKHELRNQAPSLFDPKLDLEYSCFCSST